MKRAALLAAGFAVLLVAFLEVTLRIVGYATPEWYQLDTRLGWSPKRHKHGWAFSEGSRIAIYFSSAGLRDKERTLDKPPGVYRIVVLGDDYTEALQVPIQRTWWWQLAPAVQLCKPASKVEVLNFAVSGYGTAQELVMLETTAMRYQPDLVLLQFASRDDVMDNSFALSREKLRPFYHLDARGLARIDDSFIWTPAFDRRMQTRYQLGEALADHSRVFQLARQLVERAFTGAAAHAVSNSSSALRPPADALGENAWRITEALIGKMADYSRRNGAQFALAVAPHPLQAAQGTGYPDQRLQSLGRREHFPVITLAHALRGERFQLRSGEWSVEGHRAASARIAAGLCRQFGDKSPAP